MNNNSAKKPNYAFIDSQNLNIGTQSTGWNLDFGKFRLYLKNKYQVEKAYLFIGQMAGQELLYDKLQGMGYHLIFKPTTEYEVDGKITVKGNVDAELVLYASAKAYNEYNKAIIVSGDGDFFCLIEYLAERNKLLHIMVPNDRYSKLLRKYTKYIVQINQLKNKLRVLRTKKDQE